MRIECPTCGRAGRVPDDIAPTKTIKCPACLTTFRPLAKAKETGKPTEATLPAPVRTKPRPPVESAPVPVVPTIRPEVPAKRQSPPDLTRATPIREPRPITPEPPRPVVVEPRVIEVASPARTCDFCGESIQPTAKKCKHCGELLDPALRAADEARRIALNASKNSPVIINNNVAASATAVVGGRGTPRWSPVIAAVLSFFIPGMGQLYKGQLLNGIIWFVFTIAGYVAFIVPGLVLHLCCVIGAMTGDPYR